jgi:ribose transport system ATP-binding protein
MLSITGLTKCFGTHRALSEVQLSAAPGEVLALVGENGAGKSTLMRVLAGALQPDAGDITLAGSPFLPANPEQALRAGIGFVPQESELVPHLSVAENILLGREPTRSAIIDRARLRGRARSALAEVTTDDRPLDLDQRAAALGPSDRQLVVIARALSLSGLRLLIFDEPTSSLSAADSERLFSVIGRLQQRGLTILYISHFLEEVLRIADRYTVLRDGKSVAQGKVAETTADELVKLMTGTVAKSQSVRGGRTPGALVLETQELRGTRLPENASLELHAGEVLGIAGLVGAGRTELVRALFGLDAVRSGVVKVKSRQHPRTPERCLRLGLGLLSEDRRNEGLARSLDIAENVTLSKLPGTGPFVSRNAQDRVTATLMQRLNIGCRSPRQSVAELSGGNQQKVALARLLHHDVDILLLDEPTRGIDVRSRAEVHQTIDALVRLGKAVLLISSYWPELLEICDRIAVMHRGRLGRARPVAEWSEHSLLLEATGVAC